MQCIRSVLQQEEELRHPALTPAAAPGSPAVLITNGSFAWEAGGIPLLRHISLEIPAGRLLIVIGEVGSGECLAAGVGAFQLTLLALRAPDTCRPSTKAGQIHSNMHVHCISSLILLMCAFAVEQRRIALNGLCVT